MPLYLAAFCIFLACKRGSLPYGILCALATIGVMFALTGLSVSWFMLVLMFAPYGILAYFMHRYTYFHVKSGILRGVVAAAYFNLAIFLVYLVATRIITISLDIPVLAWIDRLGGYWVLALLGTAVLVPLDFVLSAMSGVVLKRLPAPTAAARVKKEKNADSANGAKEENADNSNPLGLPDVGAEKHDRTTDKHYDIFGYEIKDGEDDDNL